MTDPWTPPDARRLRTLNQSRVKARWFAAALLAGIACWCALICWLLR